MNVIKHGRSVRTKVQRVPIRIGQPVYRDPATGRVCLTRNTRRTRDCPAVLDAEHNRPMSSGAEAAYHGAIGATDWAADTAATAKRTAQLLTNPAELTTVARKAADRAEQAARSAVQTLKDPKKAQQAAHDAWDRTMDGAHAAREGGVSWYNLPTQKKLDGAAEGAVKGTLSAGTTAVVGAVIPGGGAGLAVAEELEKDAAKGAAHLLEEAAEAKHAPRSLPPKAAPKGLLSGPPESIKPPEPGRFIVDPKGNVIIEPIGGTTGGNAQGTFTITRYSNGSPAYEVHERHPKTQTKESHGHWNAPGTGPDRKQWGQRLDIHGQPVPTESPAAHWKVQK